MASLEGDGLVRSGAPPLLIRLGTSAATIPTGGGRSDLSRVPHIIALQRTGEILHCIKYGKGLTDNYKWICDCLTAWAPVMFVGDH